MNIKDYSTRHCEYHRLLNKTLWMSWTIQQDTVNIIDYSAKHRVIKNVQCAALNTLKCTAITDKCWYWRILMHTVWMLPTECMEGISHNQVIQNTNSKCPGSIMETGQRWESLNQFIHTSSTQPLAQDIQYYKLSTHTTFSRLIMWGQDSSAGRRSWVWFGGQHWGAVGEFSSPKLTFCIFYAVYIPALCYCSGT